MPDDLRLLVEAARQGDGAAFETLYERFERSTYALCYNLLNDPEAAADAVQDTFAGLYERIGGLRHPEAFAAWLRTAAVNACRYQTRRLKWGRLVGGTPAAEALAAAPDERPGAAERMERDELARQVRRALAQLSPAHREVVVLHHFEGLAVADIAQTLGVAEGTVKSRLGRARERLERLLGPYLGA